MDTDLFYKKLFKVPNVWDSNQTNDGQSEFYCKSAT